MAVLYVKDQNGKFVPIPSLRGRKGDTPVRGVDYWTEEDVRQIQGYIDEQIADVSDEVERLNEEIVNQGRSINDLFDDVADLKENGGTAGDAGDTGDITKVNEVLADHDDLLYTTSYNLFNPDDVTDDKAISSSTGAISNNTSYWVSGYIPVDPGKAFKCSASVYRVYGYDETKAPVALIKGSTAAGNELSAAPDGVAFIRVQFQKTVSPIDIKDDILFCYAENYTLGYTPHKVPAYFEREIFDEYAKRNDGQFYRGKILNIAYSSVTGVTPINTAVGYLTHAHIGFDAIKGDMRLTSDNKIVMCHDAGFTFDADGRITSYDAANSTLIHDLTYDQCMALEYTTFFGETGVYCPVADLDEYIRICKVTGKIAFVTFRPEYLVETALELFRVLDKYDMRGHAIINSLGYTCLDTIRTYDPYIACSYTMSNGVLTKSAVDTAIRIGNCAVGIFDTLEKVQESADMIAYAKENGVPVFSAIIDTMERYQGCIDCGVTGFHISRPLFDYDPSTIILNVTVSGNTASEINNRFGRQAYDADVSIDGKTMTLRRIRNYGSESKCGDVLPELWLYRLPYEMVATNQNGETLVCDWKPYLHRGLTITGNSDFADGDVVTLKVVI